MPVLTWKHNTTADDAVARLKAELAASEYAGNVKVQGRAFAAKAGIRGFLLDLKGRVTDEAVEVDYSTGLKGANALAGLRGVLERLFPGGEVR